MGANRVDKNTRARVGGVSPIQPVTMVVPEQLTCSCFSINNSSNDKFKPKGNILTLVVMLFKGFFY